MQVATTTPQTSRELLAAAPHMAKVLKVVELRKASLSSILLYLSDNMIQSIQVEYIFRFSVSC
jgi:hypothetical protein